MLRAAFVSNGAWVERWLSEPRFARYLAETNGDQDRALAFYEWNLNLGAALMRDVAHIEIAVRNAYDETMCSRWQGSEHWLIGPASPVQAPLLRRRRGKSMDLNSRNRKAIAEAKSRVGGMFPKPGQVIAELSFGFWRHCTDSAHEKGLWVPYLHHAFPKGTNRAAIEQSLTLINRVRNRASHHEPLFGVNPQPHMSQAYDAIIYLSNLLLPDLADYIRDTSKISAVQAARP